MTSTEERKYYLPEGMPAPAPGPDDLEKPFWDAAKEHRLLVQRCNDCKAWQWGPEWICNECLSFDVGWEEVAPTGAIYSWERAWYPVHPAVKEALPYLTVLVELPQAGNIRMVGNLLGESEQDVVIGSAVEAVFEDHDGEMAYTLIQWQVKD